MRHLKAFLIAAPVAAGILLAPAAQAEGRHPGGGYGGGQGWGQGGYGHDGGAPGWSGHGGGGHAWNGHGGGGHGHYRHHAYQGHHYQPRFEARHGNDGALAAMVLGLGAAAIIGGVIASQPQYTPPPVAYAQPGYYPGNGYAVPYGYAPQYGN
jgi:hypothetical protein